MSRAGVATIAGLLVISLVTIGVGVIRTEQEKDQHGYYIFKVAEDPVWKYCQLNPAFYLVPDQYPHGPRTYERICGLELPKQFEPYFLATP